ncbi:MAG: methyltransferase domain-containing protein [Patescibacteria group bacterium]|jgi:hypothetical protein
MNEKTTKSLPVWFFTNEKLGQFFAKNEHNQPIERVYAIGGAGDFAFSLLAQDVRNKIKEIDLCDIRPMANVTIDLKIALFKNYDLSQIKSLFWGRSEDTLGSIYAKLKSTLPPAVLSAVKKSGAGKFSESLKKSGLWYRESWRKAKDVEGYLPYLSSESNYRLMQKNLDKIVIHEGDFNDNLKSAGDGYYDLIYCSNILDSETYCKFPDQYLQNIQAKLKDGGILFVLTQNNPKKMIKLIEKQGIHSLRSELHKFSPLSLLSNHYSYSILLFQKAER